MKVTTDGCLFGAWLADSMKTGGERVLDVGAGTGLLSLMLAQKSNALIDAIEIVKDAFEQANENIDASPWKRRINIYHADATKFSFPSKYDLIVSNPPFYENELKSDDAKKNIAHHGGITLQQLLGLIKENLSDGGKFFLLLPYKRNQEFEKLIRTNNLSIIRQTFVRQSVTHDFFRVMIEGKHKQLEDKLALNEISIWNNQQQYTPEFTALLKDYYLHL